MLCSMTAQSSILEPVPEMMNRYQIEKLKECYPVRIVEWT